MLCDQWLMRNACRMCYIKMRRGMKFGTKACKSNDGGGKGETGRESGRIVIC